MNRIFVLIHITFVLISCNVSTKNEELSVFRYNSESGITSLDPAFATSQDNIWAVNQLFNGLVQLDTNLQIQPCIAKSWEISDSGKIYTFHLRNDVYFHSDESLNETQRRVTAYDFKYSFNRIIDPITASPGAWIFNGKVVNDGFAVINDSTFQITLNEAFAPFLGILSMPYCMVVPQEAVEYYGKGFARKPIGTGPFQFFVWEQDVSLVMHKNPNYFEEINGKRLPHLDAVQINFLGNKQMALLQTLKGKLDMFSGITSTSKDVVLDKDGDIQPNLTEKLVLEKKPFLNTEYLAIQVDPELVQKPFDNTLFRQAISLAIDRNKMIRNLRNGVGTPAAGGFIPIGLPGYHESQFSRFDIEAAKQKLEESGYLEHPLPITLTTTKDYLDLCVFIQKSVEDIGVKCEIEVLPSSELKAQKRNGNKAFFRASWIMDYPDAENYLSCFYSKNFAPSGPNYTHFKNDAFDKLYERALIESDDEKRISMYQQLDSILMSEQPIVVLFYDQSVRLLNKQVTGLVNNPLNIPTIKYAEKQ